MARLPGAALATRPLHFFWMCDCSGSMSVDGKIDSLNAAIRESLPQMRQVAADNPNAEVLIRVLRFSHGAKWSTPEPVHLERFQWKDLEADALQSVDTDVVFLLDTSGSMGGEIDEVKRSCSAFADLIIKKGARVRLGLIGFDIGGHRGATEAGYKVYSLARYTIGIWPLVSPLEFKKNIASLGLGLFGGGGCYLADRDSIDMFPHVVDAFTGPRGNIRMLVVISDEMGSADGVGEIVSRLKKAGVMTYVLGVSGGSGAHEAIAKGTRGKFWDINQSKGAQDFGELFSDVAETIGKEVTIKLSDGRVSGGTDLGAALRLASEELAIPPMPGRALPPVIVLTSDGRPTDDFDAGLNALMNQPWGRKSVRIAIAIGRDADAGILKKFLGNAELEPLQSNNADALLRHIRWASTAVLKAASAPASQFEKGGNKGSPVPIPTPPTVDGGDENWVW